MARFSATMVLPRAREGDVSGMPGALAIMAERLRDGDLDAEEIAFLSGALEQIARASDPAKEAAAALLLVRPRGGHTRADSFDLALPRAERAYALIDGQGMRHEAAFRQIADEEGVDDSRISKAYYRYRGGIEQDHRLKEEQRQEDGS